MAAWVIIALIIAAVILYFSWKAIFGEKTPPPPRPKHNYEIHERTYNDGSKKYAVTFLAYPQHNDYQTWHYLGKELPRDFVVTLFDTKEEAIEAAQKHWGGLRKGPEVTVELLVIGEEAV